MLQLSRILIEMNDYVHVHVVSMLAIHSSQAMSTNVQESVACSQNVAYDTVSSTLKMPSQDKVTCIAYATVKETKEDSKGKMIPMQTALYDEVLLH